MTSPETALQQLHSQWCAMTGSTERFQWYVREWADFARHYDAVTLGNVVRFVMAENARREVRYQKKLLIRNIIGDLQVFDSIRAEMELARKAQSARKRGWKANAGQIARAAMTLSEPKPPNTPARRVTMELLIDSLRKAI